MTTTYHDPIPAGAALNSSVVNRPLGQLDEAVLDMLRGRIGFKQVNFGSASDLTIADGRVTISRSHHRVDTEAAAATDDLDFIDGGAIGDFLLLRLVNSSRQVRIRDGAGNIRLDGGNITLTSADQVVALVRGRNNWGVSVITAPQTVGIGGTWTAIVPRTVLSASATTILVSSAIPATYKALALILELRTDAATSDADQATIKINSDATTANYHATTKRLRTAFGNAETLGIAAGLFVNFAATASNTPPDTYAYLEVYFPNYADAGVNRLVQWRGYIPSRGGGTDALHAELGGGRWLNTSAAISRLDVDKSVGNFLSGCAYALYGIN